MKIVCTAKAHKFVTNWYYTFTHSMLLILAQTQAIQVSLRGVCSGKTKGRISVLCFSRLIKDSMTSDVDI